MKVSLETRQGLHGNPNISYTIMACRDSYNCKDTLKAMGFRWNPNGAAWEKEVSYSDFLTRYIEIVVKCEMTYDEMEESLALLPADVQTQELSDDVLTQYNDYMDSHPEWF